MTDAYGFVGVYSRTIVVFTYVQNLTKVRKYSVFETRPLESVNRYTNIFFMTIKITIVIFRLNTASLHGHTTA